MSELPDTVLYDKRLIERHVAKGLITRKEVEKRLGDTEDLTDQAKSISLEALTKHPENTSADEGSSPADE